MAICHGVLLTCGDENGSNIIRDQLFGVPLVRAAEGIGHVRVEVNIKRLQGRHKYYRNDYSEKRAVPT